MCRVDGVILTSLGRSVAASTPPARHRRDQCSITQITSGDILYAGGASPYAGPAGLALPKVAFQASYCSRSDWATVAAVTANAASNWPECESC